MAASRRLANVSDHQAQQSLQYEVPIWFSRRTAFLEQWSGQDALTVNHDQRTDTLAKAK
ncbi:MAG: hypothetical protein J7L99_02640 [Planctomycetes bacterium]|nr:hypothetical protein [Planctomycetota bacterium]